MSVEKMIMMNIIGDIFDADNVLKDILISNKVDLVSALNQIEENNFVLNLKDENIEKLVDLNSIKPFDKDNDYKDLVKKAEELKRIFHIESVHEKKVPDSLISKEDISRELEEIYGLVQEYNEKIKEVKERLDEVEGFLKDFTIPESFSISVDELRNLEYFDYKFGLLSREDKIRVRKNYENILAGIFHVGNNKDGEVYLVIYPSIVKDEMDRILRSLNFREIYIPENYKGTISEIKKQLEDEKLKLKAEMESYQKALDVLNKKYEEKVIFILDQLDYKLKIEEYKNKLARSSKFFYLSGWISENDKDEMEKLMKNYNTVITFNSESNITPPTKLKNNWLFKPFETLVRMYGVPSYNELDPTPFFSISYLILFGAMFGDLGQGLIIFLGGLILSRKNKMFGDILGRLGLSSMIFGILYGEVFGSENIIPALFIRPFENINTVLVIAIILGIMLILVSYILGIANSIKRRDIEEGLFGKEGVVGLIFYLCLLALVGGTFIGKTILPKGVGIAIILLCICGIVMKEPLTNLITRKRPLHGTDVSGYYIESVFSLIEVILSMLSGTVSFIRVGAFALTHVGLFVAFKTIGEMIGSSTGNIIVLVIGNIVVIGLEGLIVFIQGLRLQYYELFSRYYKGDGREFTPASIK